MPKLDLTTMVTTNQYQFTAMDIGDLGASEYTLVSIVCDVSGSVAPFAKQMEACIKSTVEACRRNPRADNLLVRLATFNQNLSEAHGFKELSLLDGKDYDGALKISGSTALYEATFEAIDATIRYGKALVDRDFSVNALIFVITDGMDNASHRTPAEIGTLISDARFDESLDSLTTVLIGATGNGSIRVGLETFQKQACLDHYMVLGEANKERLAKLAGFLSHSISLASRSLGSGGSVPLRI